MDTKSEKIALFRYGLVAILVIEVLRNSSAPLKNLRDKSFSFCYRRLDACHQGTPAMA